MARPSWIAATIVAKLLSVSTRSAASFATSVPEFMAIPASLRFNAGASSIPSPVIATTAPFRCKTSPILNLCSGETRSNSASLNCSRSAPVIDGPGMIPSSFALATAVSLWSPVIMMRTIPARLQYPIASYTSSRGGSVMPRSPTKIRSRSTVSGVSCSRSSSRNSRYATPMSR